MAPNGRSVNESAPADSDRSSEEHIDNQRQELPEEFEDRFRELMRNMGLANIGGGRNFRIGGHQIDACGGINDTLLVFDCTISRGRRNTAGQIRTKIEQWRGRSRAVREGIRSIETYSAYRTIEYVIAANAPVRQVDLEFGGQGTPRVSVLSKQQIEYLERITHDLGPYAKFKLAALLGIRIQRESRPIPAIRAVDRQRSFYLFFAPATEIAELAFVPQAEAGFSYFYQRLVKRSKIKAIQRYVSSVVRPFPNSVVISLDREPTFRPMPRPGGNASWPGYQGVTLGTMELPGQYGCCWVVDGQHRIYGSALGSTDILLPVTLVPARNIERAKYFLDVNSNQTKIDPNLLWYLRGLLTPNEPEGLISLACQRLDEIENPLTNKIRIPPKGGVRSRPIRLSGLCYATLRNRVITLQQYGADNPETIRHLSSDLASWFTNVGSSVTNATTKDDFLLDNEGLPVLIAVFRRVAKKLERRRPTSSDMTIYANALARWAEQLGPGEPKILATRCASEVGRVQVADEIVFAMNSHLEPSFRLELSGQAQDLLNDIVRFEAEARRTLDQVFSAAFGEGWLSQASLGQAGREPRSADELTLGQVKMLLSRDQYWGRIESHFTALRLSREFTQSLFQYVIDFRNAHMHNRPEELRTIDPGMVRTALSSLRRCLTI